MRKRYAPGLTPLICLAAIAAAGVTYADGPGAYRPREQTATTAEEGAIEAYNEGFAAIQQAERPGTSAQDAQQAYKQALAKFELAARRDRSMHEAFTYIGYANRKLGRYPDALAAYEKALRLNPDYPHAIEYQGEAFLGLNRIDEAKFNYLRLYALAPPQADKLLEAMRHWVERNSAKPPEGVDMQAFSAWVAARTSMSGNTRSSGAW